MSNETDLDWLARNVHAWSAGKLEVLVRYPRNVDTLIWSSVSSDAGWITKGQWLARRAELQNKPSWEDAPEWGEWLAQDEDGEWKWLAGLPGKYVDGWTAVKIKGCCKGLDLGDWRDTLEKRPEKAAFAPFISTEDSQEKDMTKQQETKQDRGWFERGELPPVGMAVQLWHGGTYAYDCEFIAKRGNNLVLWNLTWDRPDSADCMMCEFRPIRTERDVLIEIIKKTDDTDDKIADAILAAGFKREWGAA